ncbi:MAG: hypothetical protein M1839_009358 [Geoglossum umbratile]|nr:MAG: hypothetical protein M1839_009358 [Geoglossum umbratile]
MNLTSTAASQSTDPQPVTTVDSTSDSYAGHLNHLSEHQESQLAAFKSALSDQGLWKPDDGDGKPSHDDATLLRFLRASKFEVNGAASHFRDTEHYLEEQRVPELYETFDVGFYERARKLVTFQGPPRSSAPANLALQYGQWTGRRDKQGNPLYVYEFKRLSSEDIDAYAREAEAYKQLLPYHANLPTPAKTLPLLALYHNIAHFVLPLCNTLPRPHPETPTMSTNIIDVSGVGLRAFWRLKPHIQAASTLTAHYPELLARTYVVGAPAFFPTVWGWASRWFDPAMAERIVVVGRGDLTGTLEKWVAMEDVPRQYGGGLEWEFGDSPCMDEAVREAVERGGRKGWVEGPCLWVGDVRVPVGTEEGSKRR